VGSDGRVANPKNCGTVGSPVTLDLAAIPVYSFIQSI
jgi:hypothetical protein